MNYHMMLLVLPSFGGEIYTQPHPEGDGLTRAIEDALGHAGIGPEGIDLISLHGTGTPANDAAEYAAVARVFGDRLEQCHAKGVVEGLFLELGHGGADLCVGVR